MKSKYIISKYMAFTVSDHMRGCVVKILWEPLGPGLKSDITYENIFDVASDLQEGCFYEEFKYFVQKYVKWIPHKLYVNLQKSKKLSVAIKLLGGIPFCFDQRVITAVVDSSDSYFDVDMANAANALLLMKYSLDY